MKRSASEPGLTDLKGKNKTFPPPSPPCKVVPLFKLPVENNNTLTLNGGERGGV